MKKHTKYLAEKAAATFGPDDEKWTEGRKILSAKWEEQTSNLIRPRFKRDHKTQKRMQCAINYTDFYNYFIPKYRKEI